jgi:hypothetical protein
MSAERVGSAGSVSGYTLASEIEKLMPPPSKEHESSEFALSLSCGPVLGLIRAMDVVELAEDGR